jgi:Na+-translocating ferredoxin:NAD+ oxidoreductase RnfA subunit
MRGIFILVGVFLAALGLCGWIGISTMSDHSQTMCVGLGTFVYLISAPLYRNIN